MATARGNDAFLTLELEALEPIVVGLSALVIVRVINKSPAPATVSSRLNLMEGDVRLSIEGPHGATRALKGWQADSAARRVELPPGHQLEGAINLLWTDAGAAFPEPGHYVLRAEYDPSPNAETIVSPPVTVTARSPRTKEERDVASMLDGEPIRKALVWAQAEPEADKLQTLAQQYPKTLDGKLAGLLLSGGGDRAHADLAFQSPEPVTLARWITALSTPYSNVGKTLGADFAARIQSRDGKTRGSKAVERALQVMKIQPVERE
jgi:hypothetical protein